MSEFSDGRERVLTVGVAVARSGRLANLGDPLDFAMTLMEEKLAGAGSVGGGRSRTRLDRPPFSVQVGCSLL